MRIPGRPFGGPFTGKLSAYEGLHLQAKNLHMGYTGRKIGPRPPAPARWIRESERMFAPAAFSQKNVEIPWQIEIRAGTPVCGTPKRLRLILSPRAVVSVIVTAVAECDLVGGVLVGVGAGFTPSALSVTNVVITLVPHHRKVIALVQRVFQSALTRNGRVRVVRTIPAVNRAMNVFFHLTFPHFLFGHWAPCRCTYRTCFHQCKWSSSSSISDNS